jgi:dTDP-4-dehydrorhamnose reductase
MPIGRIARTWRVLVFMTRILVTGATGLLGHSLLPRLVADGYDVVGQGRMTGDVSCDLTDAVQCHSVLDSVHPDVIVNLAALTSVDECERSPQNAYLANVRIVENLSEWLYTRGSNAHLVQLSTDQVYDAAGANREENVAITNHYAWSKYAGELAARCVPSTILRTTFFGRSRHPTRKSFSDWIVDSLTSGRPITVVEDVTFSPLSMVRLAEMLTKVVRRRINGTYNLGSVSGMSKADFAFQVAAHLDLSTDNMTLGRSKDLALAAPRPTGMCMDPTRFERAFDVRLPSLDSEIASACAEYATNLG